MAWAKMSGAGDAKMEKREKVECVILSISTTIQLSAYSPAVCDSPDKARSVKALASKRENAREFATRSILCHNSIKRLRDTGEIHKDVPE